jgi:NAD-dependent dihydropyrimidine dehydrogenase PreA subunit
MSYRIVIDFDRCDGNGTCRDMCPQDCFYEPVNGKAALKENYDCIGCLGCVNACPKEALTLVES